MRSRLLIFGSLCLMSCCGFAMDRSAQIYSEELGRVVATALSVERDRVMLESSRRGLIGFLAWAVGGIVRTTFKGCVAVGGIAVRHPMATIVTCLVGTGLFFALCPKARCAVNSRLKNFWDNYQRTHPNNIFSRLYGVWQMCCPSEEFLAAQEREKQGFLAQQAQQREQCAVLAESLKQQKEREEAVGKRLNEAQEQITKIPQLLATIEVLQKQTEQQSAQLTQLGALVNQHFQGSAGQTGIIDHMKNFGKRVNEVEEKLSGVLNAVDVRVGVAVKVLDDRNAHALADGRIALVGQITELLSQHGFEVAKQ